MAKKVTITLSAVDQASDDIKKVQGSLSDMGRNTSSVGERWDNLKDTIGNLAGAAAVVGGLAYATWELAQAGEGVRDLGVQFDAYLSRLDADANMLDRLHIVTRGSVDDATLMRSAVDAYRLAGAATEDQIVELIEIGNTLGGGREGVEALIGVLRNGSSAIEVLDTAGLSAANVRQRWEELKKTMEDSDEAFRLAVLEEGRAQLDKYGDSLAGMVSEMDVLGASIKNIWDQFALGVARSVEDIARNANPILAAGGAGYLDEIVNQLLFGSDAYQEVRMNEARQQVATVFEAVRAEAEAQSGVTLDPAYAPVLQDILAFGEMNPDIYTDMGAFNAMLDEMGIKLEHSREMLTDVAGYALPAYQHALWLANQQEQTASSGGFGGSSSAAQTIAAQEDAYMSFETTRNAAIVASSLAMGEQNRRLELQGFILRNVNRGWDEARGFIEDAQQAFRDYNEQQDMMLFGGAADFFATTSFERPEVGGMQLFSEGEAAQMRAMADEYQRFVDSMANNDLIAPEDLARFQEGANYADQMASDMERGRDALKEMSLSDIFGTGDGGAAGEMTDAVVQAAQDAGVSQEIIDAWQAQMDLASGRATEASNIFTQEQIPAIVAAMESMKTEGAVDLAIGILEQVATDAAGLPVEWTTDGFTAVTDNIVTPMAEAHGHITLMSQEMAEMMTGDKTVHVRFRVDADGSELARLLGPYLNLNIAQAVQNNGGAVPGTDPRSSPTNTRTRD